MNAQSFCFVVMRLIKIKTSLRFMNDGAFVAPRLIFVRQSSFFAVVSIFSVTDSDDVYAEHSEPISD